MKNIIGVVGLGTMGLPMAENLAKNNFNVLGFDVVHKRSKYIHILDSLGTLLKK